MLLMKGKANEKLDENSCGFDPCSRFVRLLSKISRRAKATNTCGSAETGDAGSPEAGHAL